MWRSLLTATTAVALLVTLVSGVQTSRAEFRDSTDSSGSLFAAGTVEVGTESARLAIDVVGLEPTMTVSDCVEVRYTGTLAPADVGLHASSIAQGGLEPYLLVEIDEGTGAGDGTCAAFVSDGIVFSGTAEQLLTDHGYDASAVGRWVAESDEATRSYRVTVRVADDNAAQGLQTAFELIVEGKPRAGS